MSNPTYPPFDPEKHLAEVRARFERQELTPESVEKIEDVTAEFANFAAWIVLATPVSREQSLALTALQEAKFWANDAIAHAKGEQA